MTSYRLGGSVLRADLDADEVLLNTETGQYHLLNRTGRHVLASLEHGEDLAHAARRLAEETGAELTRVEADVDAFVGALVERGLVERVDG